MYNFNRYIREVIRQLNIYSVKDKTNKYRTTWKQNTNRLNEKRLKKQI